MKKITSIVILLALITIFLIYDVFAQAKIKIKVAKHIVSGSGVTAEQMEAWVAQMNKDWACSFEFEQVGPPDTVSNVGDGKVAGAINIYGSSFAMDPPGSPCQQPGNPGRCFDQNHIELGKDAPAGSASHEFGHWVGAKPDNTGSEHGNPTGQYPDYPGYMGSDTDGDGDQDADDRNNVMYPGKKRTGANTDNTQQERARTNADNWLKSLTAIDTGRGHDGTDPKLDAGCNYEDINYFKFWGWGYSSQDYQFHGNILLEIFDKTHPTLIGFYFETDRNPATGLPPDGIDYYVGYRLDQAVASFMRYDQSWIPLSTSGINTDFSYLCYDAPLDPEPIGVKFDFPLTLFERKSGDTMSFKAAAEHNEMGSTYYDYTPDQGLIEISTAPASVNKHWTIY